MTDFIPGKTPNVPKGYTGIQLYDRKKGQAKMYYVPVGTKINLNGKTYDPSKGKNNQLVVTNDKNDNGFKIVGLTLENMDVNGDGKIDSRDNDPQFAKHLNADLKKAGVKGAVREGEMSQTQLNKGQGGAVLYRNASDASSVFYGTELYKD